MNFKIAVACFMGAFIGASIGLQMNHNMWWVGVLIGGLVGYIAYQPKEVISATKRVCADMYSKRSKMTESLLSGAMILGYLVLIMGGLVLITSICALSLINTAELYLGVSIFNDNGKALLSNG